MSQEWTILDWTGKPQGKLVQFKIIHFWNLRSPILHSVFWRRFAIGLTMTLMFVGTIVSQEPFGSVSGTFIDSSTQAPASGIRVVIQGGGETTTNNAGQFRISNVSPGKHIIQGVRSGWTTLLPDGSEATVTVAPGEEVRNLRLQLAGFGVVRGQVRDSAGQPVSGILVQAWLAAYQQGRRILVAPSQAVGVINPSAETDANGEYHFDLPPGVYYVSTQHRTPGSGENGAARALGDSLRVYYPGTSDIALAATVKLSGGEVPGIDFKMPATRGELHKVYVRIDGNARALNSYMAGSQIAELQDRISLERIPIVGSFLRGNFTSQELTIDAVPDGSFDLFIDGVMENGVRARGVTPIDVRGEDLHDVRVTLQLPQDISGRVFNVDTSKAMPLSGLTVHLGSRPASVDAHGAFIVANVPGGYHAVSVEGLPPEAYVSDIRYGGKSLHETARSLNGPELEAGLASASLEILVATNSGTVDGVVDGRAAAAGATVVLVPPTSRRFVQSYYKMAIAGPSGGFSIKGVPPGVYQIFAWDRVPDTAWLNPQFMSGWEGRGQTVSVEEGRSINVAPRLLHMEEFR